MTMEALRGDLSRKELGDLADVNPATVWRIELGLVKPRPTTIVRLARALGTSVGTVKKALAEGAKVGEAS